MRGLAAETAVFNGLTDVYTRGLAAETAAFNGLTDVYEYEYEYVYVVGGRRGYHSR